MYINPDILSYIIGGLILSVLLFPLVVKEYVHLKTKNKMGIIAIPQTGKGTLYLQQLTGIATEPNARGRSYIPKSKHKNPETNKSEGNIFDLDYPIGMPHFFQVPIKVMITPVGNPMGVNLYSDQDLKITDHEIGAIKKETFTKNVIAASEDTPDLLKEIKKQAVKPGLNRIVVYIMLGVAIVGILAVAFLSYQNSQAISDLGRMWGW